MVPDDIAPNTVITGFDVQVPLNGAACQSQIEESMHRGLPDAVSRRRLAVIASGPSARDVDLAALGCPTLALNGAMSLFLEQGLAPTYWACCDPQPLVADFLPAAPPRDTVYFVASKCHSSVFDKLKGCDVRLWHLQDYPVLGHKNTAVCSTVTLSATWLMESLGYTDFEYWGWDGCFRDGAHHATNKDDWTGIVETTYINYGGAIKDGEVIGGRNFATTRSWALEAQGAEQFFQLAKYFDLGVTIHGDGMFKRAKEALDSAG